MNNCISYSPRASLAIVGMNIQQMGIWEMIGQQVKIHQKTVSHTPLQKLQDAFINIMAGGQGIVEVNQRVKPDAGLSAAFGRQGCADQSGVSTTLNACQAENVVQMRQAMTAIYRRYGAGYGHDYGRSWQLLDVDMSGMPAGRQGDGSEKGYFAKQKNKRGRQLGRVYATLYDEIVSERLYSGRTQLNRSLQELVVAAEAILNLNPGFRKRTILRIDGGGGNDADINQLLTGGYKLLVKVTHWKRVQKLAATVVTWQTDPKDPKRQAGWVPHPLPITNPHANWPFAVRRKKGNGKRLSWSSIWMMTNLAGSMNKVNALFPRLLTRFGWLSMPMTCAVVGWKPPSKAPNKGWASSNATKSRSMLKKCCCCWPNWLTISSVGCATGWLPVRLDCGNSACCAWFAMPFILRVCLLSIPRVISSKFHSIKRIN